MKNKIKIFSYIILTIFIIDVIKCDITIIGPNDLSSQFKNKLIGMTFDKIGKSNYDFYTRGQLFLDENNLEACQNVKIPKLNVDTPYNEEFRVLITKRGGCSFVHKARNAQIGGYSMVIVVNNMQTDIKKIIMTDDGSGNDIFIPIAMISQEDGEKIIDYLQNNKRSKVILKIK